jgi:FERM N-terminal domain
VQKQAKGQALFDKVCQHINLLEKDYFSCSFRDSRNVRVSKWQLICFIWLVIQTEQDHVYMCACVERLDNSHLAHTEALPLRQQGQQMGKRNQNCGEGLSRWPFNSCYV